MGSHTMWVSIFVILQIPLALYCRPLVYTFVELDMRCMGSYLFISFLWMKSICDTLRTRDAASCLKCGLMEARLKVSVLVLAAKDCFFNELPDDWLSSEAWMACKFLLCVTKRTTIRRFRAEQYYEDKTENLYDSIPEGVRQTSRFTESSSVIQSSRYQFMADDFDRSLGISR